MNHALLNSTQVKNSVSDGYVIIEDESWFRIADVHLMPEFFMSPVSSGDHWMFISSRGALTAGRRNPDTALFPYYSSDKLIDHASCTGAKTIIRKKIGDGGFATWEPFAQSIASGAAIRRNLYKNWLGNRLLFGLAHGAAESRQTTDVLAIFSWH